MYISRLRDPWGKINTQASPGPTGLQALGGKNGSLPAQNFAVRTMPYIRRLWSRSSKMAKKYLTSFKPGDVLMVVLRCVSCGGESSFPVSGSSLGPITTKCHACGKERDPASIRPIWHCQLVREPRQDATLGIDEGLWDVRWSWCRRSTESGWQHRKRDGSGR